MISDKELWACAVQMMKQYGDNGPQHIAERIGDLARKGDHAGVLTWKAIAFRFDELAFAETAIQ